MARRKRYPAWLLIVGCVVLTTLLVCGVTFLWTGYGGSDLCLGQSDGPSLPDDIRWAPLVWSGLPLPAVLLGLVHCPGPGLLPEGSPDPVLLAAVPGGLCLLI